MITKAQSDRRIIKRIVFGYSLDNFPGALIIGQHTLQRKLERAGFDVSVSFCPLSDLSADTDILIVAPELVPAACQAAPHSHVQIVEDFINHPAYDELIEQLQSGKEWTAARLADRPAATEEGKIFKYRGYERID